MRWLVTAAAAAVLAACGGGGDDPAPGAAAPSPTTEAAADERKKVNAVFVPTNIPADANTRGMWSPVYNWPLIPLHLVMLPDFRLLSYGTDGTGRQTANFIYDIWDPEGGLSGGHMTLPNGTGTDIFCSSQLLLPDGSAVFIAGGDNWTGTATTNTGNNNSNLYSLTGNTLTRTSNMNRARWYSSSTTLLNGETYIQGGTGGTDRPEVRQANGTFRLLSNANTSTLDFMYPRNFVAPDGRVFGYDSAGRMYYVDAAGTGTFTAMGQFNSAYAGSDASAAMFRPGRILQFGGNSNGAAVIDIRGAAPTFTPTQSMSSQRRLVNGTILADGKVLATGGSRVWNELTDVNNSAEIWNPDTGGWTVGASGNRARLYHSVAMLMPDASVLVGGGGAPGPQNNTNIEIYFPPYLFKAGGVLAARPAITAAPTVLDIGKTFRLQVGNGAAIGRVVLIKTGSVTHSWNMEQRFIELTYTRNGNDLTVQAPTRAGDAPPGYYMVFVLDTAGVPSVARMVSMNVAATPNPAITPALANPGDRSTVVGTTVSLQLNATDPNGDVLGYGATGLPPGLSPNGTTGLISGAPTTTGTYNVVVAASDGVNSATASFTWTITGAPTLSVSVPLAPAATQAGGTATFTAATANGINPRYKWNFGDGSAETAYSTSPTATHTYTAPGLYLVTVTAIDDRGVEQRASVLQPIYLPLTAQKPSASSNIAFETRSGNNPRVWVVNQDNDTVSVFDAVTRGKVAEVAVGAAPRSVAVASNGMLWVANKQSATISVIDPGTLAVGRTIALPRGSQPFGIAMAPAGGAALVALEATGQVLKFDTASYAQTGSAAVGGNPRHVAIGASGTAYVSRFVTAPLPGEGTAVVNTAGVGAAVVRLDAATMAVQGTTLLAHSDKEDFENQGRGIPNYLGAAAISPDGTQAWVPSKQDNIKRGTLRDGNNLNFQNTVRAVSSRIDLATNQETLGARIDHDNASMASAALFEPNGLYLFVALETSREVAVVDAHGRREVMRFDVGRAPQGLAMSADGATLFVSNFMDRSVGVYDLRPLRQQGLASVPLLATLNSVATERLSATVLNGKRLFYDARDTRLARDRYMSCASCHNDGGHDGRVWDLTGMGEGLRNTIALRGRAGLGQGFLHWSNNFDEVQDFEGQIRNLAGGTGLMTDAQFTTGTRSQPLGTTKAGVSADLDALAAYVASLDTFEPSPVRPSASTLSAAATAGKALFTSMNCAACHGGNGFTNSGANTLSNVGTIKPSSGQRLGAALTGIDVPTLRDVWATAPYLHDGSAPTLEAAVRAHNSVSITDANLANLVAYLKEIGSEEGAAPSPTGSGLSGNYYNNVSLTGTPVLTRVETVNFNWGNAAPGAGVNADNFSVRWTGTIAPTTSGTHRFQTYSDDGVRVWVNGTQVINNWTDHSPTTNTSGNVSLTAGQRYTITVEYYEKGGGAVMQLRWRLPNQTAYGAIPASTLYPN
jgi:YVTN family beta-propeller protein